VDGVPHNDAFGNWVSWASVPLLQVETIEVAPGGLSSLYGSSAMAGVIRVETRSPRARTAAARASFGSRGIADAEALGSHVHGRLGASVGAGLFRTEGYAQVAERDRGPVDVEASSRHRTANWRLDYAATPTLTLVQSGRVFAEDRENGTPLTTNSTRELHLAGGVRSSHPDGRSFAAHAFVRRNNFKSTFSAVAADRSSESLTLDQAVDGDDMGGNLQWSTAVGRSTLLTFGGDVRRIEARDAEDVYVAPALNVRDRVIPARQLLAGFYAQGVRQVRRAVVTLGARVDHWRNSDASQTETVNATGAQIVVRHPDVSETAMSPRAAVLVNVAHGWAVRGSVHAGFRAPSLNELYRPFRVGNVLTQGNPELGRERLAGMEAGLNHTPTPRLSWRATTFLDQVQDPIANLTVSSTAALITRQRTNLGRVRVRGLSVDAEYLPGSRWRLRASYALTDARVTAFSASPELEGNVLPQVPRHRATLALDHEGAPLTASLMARAESARFDDDQNRLRLRPLFVVDLSLRRPLSRSVEVFAAAENLLGTRYPVQATPVELLGTPFTLTLGARLDLRPVAVPGRTARRIGP
jgi:iron complex outermembrane receptor protein